jgi:NitT/TauT family transport system permease protein
MLRSRALLWSFSLFRAQSISQKPHMRQRLLLRVAPALAVLGFLALWQLASLRYPVFILPGPASVAVRFVERVADGTWLPHTLTTLGEALLGLMLGGAVAALAGYAIAKSALAERVLSPFVVASQGIPFVAVAPLIFIWFGSGLWAKVLLCALIVFFPILVSVAQGVRAIPGLWRDLFAMHRATRWQTFARLELPAALPMMFGGLRVGGTLAVVGAIAAEFVSANQGLGFFIAQANSLYDTPSVMVGVLTVMGMALAFYFLMGVLFRQNLQN